MGAALLACVWAARFLLDPPFQRRRTAIATAVGVYAIALIVSTFASVDVHRSLVGDVERMGGLLALAAYGLMFRARRMGRNS